MTCSQRLLNVPYTRYHGFEFGRFQTRLVVWSGHVPVEGEMLLNDCRAKGDSSYRNLYSPGMVGVTHIHAKLVPDLAHGEKVDILVWSRVFCIAVENSDLLFSHSVGN